MTRTDSQSIPFFSELVHAGFPSPADDYIESRLDISKLLIKNPASTYYIKVTGNSMIGSGIFSGDIIIVDKSLTIKNNDIIVASINGDFTVKRFVKENDKIFLVPANPDYEKIKIKNNTDFQVWGVVTYCIRDFQNDCSY